MREPVTITLSDGKPRTLRYSLGTTKRLAKQFGVSLINGKLQTLDEENLGPLLLAGLKSDDPSITLEQLEDALDNRDLREALEKFMQAFHGSAEPKNGASVAVDSQQPTTISTTSKSGQSDASTSDSPEARPPSTNAPENSGS